MALGTDDIAQLSLALALLVAAAHGFGQLFARLRQPRVVGEIVGGIVLGPTLLGLVAPGVQERIFPTEGPAATALDAVMQLGLVLLLFTAGAELRLLFHRGERRTSVAIAVTGVAIPFAAGLGLVALLDLDELSGPARSTSALVLVFAVAIAVTSIPVISRIMLDLGILGSSFARIVLTVAVLEDVALYAVLAVALGLVGAQSGDVAGLVGLLGIDPSSHWHTAYHVVATAGFLVLGLSAGSAVFRHAVTLRWNVVQRANPAAFDLVFLLAVVAGALYVGVGAVFAALVAGMVAANGGARTAESWTAVRDFSLAFFVPVYFALVGLKLDLVRDFDPLFFAWFLAFACAVKALSVYAGARLAHEPPAASRNFAVALNARGGPGIVLASVAFGAGIISESFYASLVMLAIVTSMVAGAWLERVVGTGVPLRGQRSPELQVEGLVATLTEEARRPVQAAQPRA